MSEIDYMNVNSRLIRFGLTHAVSNVNYYHQYNRHKQTVRY